MCRKKCHETTWFFKNLSHSNFCQYFADIFPTCWWHVQLNLSMLKSGTAWLHSWIWEFQSWSWKSLAQKNENSKQNIGKMTGICDGSDESQLMSKSLGEVLEKRGVWDLVETIITAVILVECSIFWAPCSLQARQNHYLAPRCNFPINDYSVYLLQQMQCSCPIQPLFFVLLMFNIELMLVNWG